MSHVSAAVEPSGPETEIESFSGKFEFLFRAKSVPTLMPSDIAYYRNGFNYNSHDPSPASITTEVKFTRVHRSHLKPLVLFSSLGSALTMQCRVRPACVAWQGLYASISPALLQIHCDVMAR